MAIQAIPDSTTAYQGSVPQTEAPVRVSEKTTGSSFPESVTKEKYAKPQASQNQGNGNGSDAQKAAEVPGMDALKRAVEEINRSATHSEAVFGVHDQTNRITIKIVDKDTKEVLKEYPPEKMLDMIAKVWEMAGLMMDEKR